MFDWLKQSAPETKPRRNAYCSFCRKSHQEVGPLVEGPGDVFICGLCVELCLSILDGEKRRRASTAPKSAATDSPRIRATLDRLIINQQDGKAVLCEAAHTRHDGPSRILLVGPSRSSMLCLAKALAFALEAPFVAGDSSSLTMPGKENLFWQLLAAADFNLDVAQRGVAFVAGMESPEAQDALLRIWAENGTQPIHGLTIDAREMLIICGATFAGHDEAIVALGRHPEQPITAQSLMGVGARPDWAAALTAIARVPPLDEQSLWRIINSVEFRRG